MQSKITLINLMAFICCAWCAVPLYQFGTGVGDRRLVNSADPAVTITLQETYVFYGEEYTHVCVSHNVILNQLPESLRGLAHTLVRVVSQVRHTQSVSLYPCDYMS